MCQPTVGHGRPLYPVGPQRQPYRDYQLLQNGGGQYGSVRSRGSPARLDAGRDRTIAVDQGETEVQMRPKSGFLRFRIRDQMQVRAQQRTTFGAFRSE